MGSIQSPVIHFGLPKVRHSEPTGGVLPPKLDLDTGEIKSLINKKGDLKVEGIEPILRRSLDKVKKYFQIKIRETWDEILKLQKPLEQKIRILIEALKNEAQIELEKGNRDNLSGIGKKLMHDYRQVASTIIQEVTIEEIEKELGTNDRVKQGI